MERYAGITDYQCDQCTVKYVSVSSLTENDFTMDNDSVDNKAEALACLMEGKRNMLCKDIPAIVSCLPEACELMSAECGDKAPECGEAYCFYGKALLELARLENVVLGNALSGIPNGDDCDKVSTQVEDPEHMTEEERTEVEEKVNEALVENFDNCEIAEPPMLMKAVANPDDVGAGKDTLDKKVMDVNDQVDDSEDEEQTLWKEVRGREKRKEGCATMRGSIFYSLAID